MTEQAQKKISKEAARMIFEAVLTIRGNGAYTTMREAVGVLQELDELVEDGGLDTVGLFLRQANREGLVESEDVERIKARQPSHLVRDFGDMRGPDELFERDALRLIANLLPVLREKTVHVEASREREANRAGLNGRKDESQRLIFVQGNAFFF